MEEVLMISSITNHKDQGIDAIYATLLFYLDMDIIRTKVQATKFWHYGTIPPPKKKRNGKNKKAIKKGS